MPPWYSATAVQNSTTMYSYEYSDSLALSLSTSISGGWAPLSPVLALEAATRHGCRRRRLRAAAHDLALLGIRQRDIPRRAKNRRGDVEVPAHHHGIKAARRWTQAAGRYIHLDIAIPSA